jgi:hypothetical protein
MSWSRRGSTLNTCSSGRGSLTVCWPGARCESYHLYCFAMREDAEAFVDRFGGEHFDPTKDRGKGKQRDCCRATAKCLSVSVCATARSVSISTMESRWPLAVMDLRSARSVVLVRRNVSTRLGRSDMMGFLPAHVELSSLKRVPPVEGPSIDAPVDLLNDFHHLREACAGAVQEYLRPGRERHPHHRSP